MNKKWKSQEQKKSGRKYKLRKIYPIGGGYLSSVWNIMIEANMMPIGGPLCLFLLFRYFE